LANSDESSCNNADPSFSAGSDVRTLIRGIGSRMLGEAWHSQAMSAKPWMLIQLKYFHKQRAST